MKRTSHRGLFRRLAAVTFHGALALCCATATARAGSPVAAAETPAGKDGEKGKDGKETKKPEPRFKISGWIDSGITFNPADPKDHQNFGHLFTDRANEPLLNQAVITAERTLKPEEGHWDWGFKVQLMLGSDARFIHYLGIFDNTMNDLVQPDLVEAWVNVHAPWLTKGGLDLKLGFWVTLLGAETIDPRTNVFYSHSYMFNFGIPFKDTGALFTLHATSWLDINAAITRGINMGWDDNNDVLAFEGGLTFNLLDGKLTIAANTHIGPEDDAVYAPAVDTNSACRWIYDAVVTWKPTDKITLITDINYGRDDGFDAEWYGVAQYFTYAVNDWLTLGVRGEVWRDDDGFAAAQYGNFDDPLDVQRGDFIGLDPRTVGGGPTTYGEITVGATIKPPGKLKDHVLIRPEIRYDRALSSNSRPFNDSTDRDQLTIGIDVILTF